MRNPSFNRDQDPNDLSFGTKTCVDVVDLANTPKGHTPLLENPQPSNVWNLSKRRDPQKIEAN